MKYRFSPFLSFCIFALTIFLQGFGMDTPSAEGVTDFSLSALPQELHTRILAIVGSELEQEKRISVLIQLREVCKQWNTILTDTFIAGAVGLPTTPCKLATALVEAAEGIKLKTVELICRVCPEKERQYLLQMALDNISHWFNGDVLKIFLKYGLSTNAKSKDDIFASFQNDGARSLLTIVQFMLFNMPEAREIFELLLEGGADTTEPGLLDRWGTTIEPYTVSKLLTYPLHPSTNYGELCEVLSRMACCKFHFSTVVNQLVQRGADVRYKQVICDLPDCCQNEEVNIFNNLFSDTYEAGQILGVDMTHLRRFDIILIEGLCKTVKKNSQLLNALNTQYGGHVLSQDEYRTYLKNLWPILDETDVLITKISRQIGQQINLWVPQYTAQGHPRLDNRNVIVKFLSKIVYPFGVLLAGCILYKYWWLPNEEDEDEADTDEQEQESSDQAPHEIVA